MQLEKQNNRIDSLDYLRGLAAVGIMCYHMQLLNFGEVDASAPLAKIKIYGVAIFYILSGLTLYKVYSKDFTIKSVKNFYIKRVFRIAPLLLLATLLTYILDREQHVSLLKLLANLAIIPGMLRADVFIANGAWSIGNECCFYLFFPLLLILAIKDKKYLWLSILFFFVIFVSFTFHVLTDEKPLGAQWSVYVNAFNQFFLFAAGLGLASLKTPPAILKKLALVFIIGLLLNIFFYPVHGEPIVLVTNFNRLILTLYVGALCYFVYIADFSFLPQFVQWLLKTLGEISFSIYLLHPIVYLSIKKVLGPAAPPSMLIACTILITLPLSYFVYNKFEKFFISLGKKNFRIPTLRFQSGKA